MKRKRKKQQKRQLSDEVHRQQAATGKVNPEALKHVRAAAAEEALIGALLLHPDRIGDIAKRLPADDMVTPFNRTLYEQIVDRHNAGLLVELPLLAASYDEDAMAYISYLAQAAQTRAESMQDMLHYVGIIQSEKALASMSPIADMSDDEARKMMEELRKLKQ